MPTTPDRPAESLLGPITPIRCTEPGCHWACHGVPDKYADSRARIVREHMAAEHAPTPESPDRPADQLRAAVARALVRYDWNAGLSGRDTPSEHHYGEADAVLAVLPAPALAVARQLLGTTTCGECGDTGACNGGPCPLTAAEETHVVTDDSDDPEHTDDCPAVPTAPPAPADRAAVLREAADTVALDRDATSGPRSGARQGMTRAVTLLRRKADEAEYIATPCSVGGCDPGGEPCTTHERLMAHAEGDHELCDHMAGEAAAGAHQTEAHPPSVEYIAEVLELDGAWEYLGADADPAVATRRRDSVTRRYPDAQTRTVRKTTTYTVEPTPAVPTTTGGTS
ncbi:hypothetical protein G3I43_07100 [Streptomyces anulatus]|uniref:Uncharacterized protein n=1 Tax=Streptomyces anulatus TaxID=1892 RepID=A0A6G3SLR2_STRAQ|nr:hypothetical protein [Streptomyces anulatus]NEB83946.1 hypothetical protein [Streptomyces anulatus]